MAAAAPVAASAPAADSAAPLPATFVPGFHDEATVRRMPYRQMNDRLISALTFGASSLVPTYRPDVSDEENKRVLLHVLKSGVNVLDTAPWYGYGESERILGRLLKELSVPRAAYYLHTKCCRYLPDVEETFDFTYARTVKSVDESLERLGVEYIDTVQVHDPEFAPNLDVVLTEVLPALAACVAAGKVRRIGLTGYPLSAIRYLADHLPPGVAVDTCLSYCRYNLHDTSLADSGTLAHLAGKGIQVIMGSPLSMGLLTPRGPPAWHPARPELKAACAAAAAHAAAAGVDIAHLAMHFALFSNPAVKTVLVSSASLPRISHDIELARGEHPLTPTEARVLAEVREKFFTGPGAPPAHWEGVEVDSYWIRLGKTLRTKWTIERAARPDLIAMPEAPAKHKA